jgi:hypothetical protein
MMWSRFQVHRWFTAQALLTLSANSEDKIGWKTKQCPWKLWPQSSVPQNPEEWLDSSTWGIKAKPIICAELLQSSFISKELQLFTVLGTVNSFVDTVRSASQRTSSSHLEICQSNYSLPPQIFHWYYCCPVRSPGSSLSFPIGSFYRAQTKVDVRVQVDRWSIFPYHYLAILIKLPNKFMSYCSHEYVFFAYMTGPLPYPLMYNIIDVALDECEWRIPGYMIRSSTSFHCAVQWNRTFWF